MAARNDAFVKPCFELLRKKSSYPLISEGRRICQLNLLTLTRRPRYFFAFLASICRHLSLNRVDWKQAAKRRAQVVPLTEEMENCIPDAVHERQMEAKELGRLLDLFLESLPKDSRLIFLRRYWYVDSVPEIAARYGMTESKVKMQLSRTKEKLRSFLEQEGIYV